ncbi:DUF2145 domain-containing protein [Rahnella variigena]|nr:DUF2145 domain-containing protein [Rahnella variigena]
MKTLCYSLSLMCCLALPAYAASSACESDIQPEVSNVSKTMANAVALKNKLNSRSDEIVILVRQGQDLGKYNIQYSHAAWASKKADGNWQVIHNLNICNTSRSALYIQGVYEFLSDDLTGKQIAILRPTPELQKRAKVMLSEPRQAKRLHDSRYSLVAYPYFWHYQNSNGWLLESFAQTYQPDISTRMQAQRWLKQKGYQPSEISASLPERILASLSSQNIFIDDRPEALIKAGKISFSSGDSVISFLGQFSQSISDCDHGKWQQNVCVFTLPE